MKLVTWNVNSLKVRLPQVLDWLAANQPDVLCLQETKQEDSQFPLDALLQAGYQAVFSGQKTYNGVAIISKVAATEVVYGLPGFPDEQKRLIAATFASDSNAKVKQACPEPSRRGGDEQTTQKTKVSAHANFACEVKPAMAAVATVLEARQGASEEANAVSPMQSGRIRVVCVYVPNGQSVDSDKYRYKLAWLAALREWLKEELVRYPKLALLGDYNIAPEDRDVHDPQAWAGNVLVSEPERAAFHALEQLGLRDSFRLFGHPEKSYSWWDYRMMAFRRNMGLRIDHIQLSAPLAQNCTGCAIDRAPRKLERPSDHTPVVAELAG